ncbi:hypothetical protein [Brachyspira alvinipulli]|uniref:hypothetical protein n=1 Tax=Brachyspira alvinipulli TaxID=84379 RepID=UPI000487A17E|nr:hypothetical protein [Brachyspira alvinipulli]
MKHYIKYISCILGIFTCSLYSMYNFNVNEAFYGKKNSNPSVVDIDDIKFEDYSMNLSIIDFPMLSTFLIVENKLPILSIFLDLYKFMGYDENVRTYISYWNFFRTLKTIEWYFVEDNDNISASFTYSSSMNVNYNSMIRDLSASYSRFRLDTNILFGIHFYL